VAVINAVLTTLFDGLLYPFRGMHPFVGVLLLSLLTAILMLVVFKRTSNQQALALAKRRIQGCLFELRLFNDDPRAILRAQSELLRHSFSYLKLSLVPMAWMLAPLVLIIAQLQSYYGYQPPAHGERFVVEARLTETAASGLGDRRPIATLRTSSDALVVETPAVWMPEEHRLAWRVALRTPGEYALTLSLDGVDAMKSFDARPEGVRRSPLKVRSGFVDQLLYPAEPLLPADGPFQTVSISLAEADLPVPGLGRALHWSLVFFALTLLFALALKRRFRVTI
jgi:hypothetical protein